MRTVIVLLALMFQVWCSPPGCEIVEIDEDGVKATCCLAVKEGVIDRQKAVIRLLSQKRSRDVPQFPFFCPEEVDYRDEDRECIEIFQ